MKLFSLATIVAAAGIAQVLAVPLLVVTTIPSVNTRPGHADKPEFVATIRKKGPCRGSRFRQKAVELSNIFREALGLPPIQGHHHHHHPSVGGDDASRVRILPFIGTPPTALTSVGGNNKDAEGEIKIVRIEINAPPPHGRRPLHGHHHAHGRHYHHHNCHHIGKGSFLHRFHYSIMNLGRWQGGAVAFVLGCGIGVLLRMFFVMAVVMFRAVKGRRGDETQYSQITIIEEIVDTPKSSLPPTYDDVKVPIVVEIVQAPTEESK